jgi:hypothetical protein
MALVELREIQDFCKNKTIALVGNSSTVLRRNLGKEIDAHDIVIRMNYVITHLNKYSLDIGKKTDIYDCEVGVPQIAAKLLSETDAQYCMRLIRWGDPNTNTKEQLLIINAAKNVYLGDPEIHGKFKQAHFTDNFKPSTGATVLNFLINFIEYRSINMYGFDFFKSAANTRNRMNEFNSYLYKDHSPMLEVNFFKKFIDDKIIKHIC